MPTVTALVGLVLVALAFGFWGASESRSWTALIPAIPGVLVLVLGIVSYKPAHRAWAIHVALVLALLTVFMVGYKLVTTIEMSQLSMALVVLTCVLYLVLGVRSFVEARRKRKADENRYTTQDVKEV